jgi:hypothetical protein
LQELTITQEMIDEANVAQNRVRVDRTKASNYDTIVGLIGEMIFSKWWYGDWQKHNVYGTKGEVDFDRIEIKTSVFPYSDRLNLLVREDYAEKRKPDFYVQIIIDIPSRTTKEILAGMKAKICGYATHEDVDSAELRDFGSKYGVRSGYKCRFIPLTQLKPIENLMFKYHSYD